MKWKLLTITFLAAILLVSCNQESSKEGQPSKVGNSEEVRELVYDLSNRKIADASASILPNQLIVQSGGEDTVYDLPKEDFFASTAPYIKKTHPWTNHSLTGCQGELDNEEFHVLIEDSEGTVIVDETRTSQPNGFMDFWLPRDQIYQVKIKHVSTGKTVESELSTKKNAGTCITTMQLT